MTWGKFHTENPEILGTTMKNLIATTSWHPGFVHACCKGLFAKNVENMQNYEVTARWFVSEIAFNCLQFKIRSLNSVSQSCYSWNNKTVKRLKSTKQNFPDYTKESCEVSESYLNLSPYSSWSVDTAALNVTTPYSNYRRLLKNPALPLRPHSVKRWNVAGLKVFTIANMRVQKIQPLPI
jgi:hypothetical protein